MALASELHELVHLAGKMEPVTDPAVLHRVDHHVPWPELMIH